MNTREPARLYPHSTLSEDPSVQQQDGPTPHGGAYSVTYFRDVRGNPVPKAWAVMAEVLEYTASGELVHRTYAEPIPMESRGF